MYRIVDAFDTSVGWSGSGSVVVHTENEHKEYIAGVGIDTSLIFNFPVGSENNYIQKTIDIDVTNYDELVLSIYSVRKGTDYFNNVNNFLYKIDFGTGKEFYIPTRKCFTAVTLDISSIINLDRIRITSLHNEEDFLVVSYMVAVKDELPKDIYQAVKDGLEDIRDNFFPYSGKQIGTVTALRGATSINIIGSKAFLGQHTVIKISDSTNSEIHHIEDFNENRVTFDRMYDGNSVLHNYNGANVYVYYPIEYGVLAREVLYPGIAIWGFVPEPTEQKSTKEIIVNSYDGSNFRVTQGGFIEKWKIAIDIMSRHPELIADMTKIIRTFLTRGTLWMNGRKYDILFDEVPVEIEPQQVYDVSGKIVYMLNVELIEDNFDKQVLPKVTTDNLSYNIRG